MKQTKKKLRFPIGYLLLALCVAFLLNSLITIPREIKIDYSEFKDLLAEDRIKEVTIEKERITGKALMAGDKGEEEKAFVTIRVEDPQLIADLRQHGVTFSGKRENTLLNSLIAWVLPLLLIVGIWIFFMRRVGRGPEFMSVGRSKAKILPEDQLDVTFDDVAGVDEATEELKEVVEFLRNPKKFTQLGGKLPKGVLLVGPPGCGKTLLAKAVAGESKVPFFSISGSEFVEMFVGVGAARVRDLFARALEKAPCIIFVDELDALGKARGINPVGGHDEREQTLNQLLVEMDGFDTKKGVILMAATNRPEILDPALLRPGRFDRHVLVDRPDIKGRQAILEIHAKEVKLAKDVDFAALAGMTPGFVGADLANVINEAALLAARRGEKAVRMAEMEEAIERIVAGLEKKTRVMNKQERRIVAYHELGHALVALSVPNADPVQKVSIIPRGIAALGYTLQRPTEDRYLMTKSELINRLTTLLGGRVAEELTFDEVSTGAQNDLVKATDIARSMVKEYGMSEAMGLVAFERNRQPLYLQTAPFSSSPEYSEETSRAIDAEIKRIVDEAHQRARKILTKKKKVLDKVAQILLEKEVIQGDELKRLVSEAG
ncbi:MAG: ATP-dependent zinc metalloprotease FtsH [Deltaproteobacteria bacterium]|nr:ATP-dependent zinc metalloprotease FtsH [Deltaproteobacteria bacterium]